MLKQNIDQVPEELRRLDQWVCWKDIDGRKIPINARTNSAAKSNDPSSWASFVDACHGFEEFHTTGVGFVFRPDDGLTGIDLDECIDDRGKIAEWALVILSRLASYAEISPSGRGIKCWVRASIDKGRKLTLGEKTATGKAPGIEIYSTGRYFTVTGERWEGSEPVIRDAQQQIGDWLIPKYWPAPAPVPELTPQHSYTSSGQGLSVAERAARYLERLDDAIEGQGGEKRTFHASCILMLGFAMTADEAWPVIAEWNQRKCVPPWDEPRLRRKLEEANKQGGERGHMLHGRRYSNSDVDLTRLFQSLERQDVPPAAISPNPSNFPQDCLSPPGFLGELIEYNLRTAIYPLPELALAGHLALLATLTGRKIEDTLWGTRTNAYFCGLGPSRGGKDHSRRINQRLLHEAGLEQYEGEENFASSSSIYSALEENPVSLYQIDEIANLLATTHDARRSPHLFKIQDVLLRLWASSKGTLKADAYADRKKNKVLTFPHCVIYGTAVPVKFWESISADNVSDGLLGRFVIFEVPTVDNGYVPARRPEKVPIPESLLRTAQGWASLQTHAGNLSELDGAHPLSMMHTPDAERRAEQHQNDVCRKRTSESREVAAVWSGTPEKTNKLALLFAASRANADMLEAGELPQIELQDVERAVAISNWLTRRMLHQVGLHVAENDWERTVQRTLNRLKVGEEVTKSKFTNLTKYLRRRERDEVIDTLVEAGFLELRTETAKTGNIINLVKRRV
jgi:hypothetical protein